MEKKPDRRVKRTCDALQQSLLSLMQHQPLEQITVRELCQKADINRGTFYLHYHDVYELYDAVQMGIMDELARTVETHCAQVREDEDPAPSIILDIFDYFTQNYQACVVIFQQDRSNVFLRRIRSVLRPRLITGPAKRQRTTTTTIWSTAASALCSTGCSPAGNSLPKLWPK